MSYRLLLFQPLWVIDAQKSTTFPPVLAWTQLKAGMYEVKKIPNPFGPKQGDPWYALAGTALGLPCQEIEKRTRYPPDSGLRVELISERRRKRSVSLKPAV